MKVSETESDRWAQLSEQLDWVFLCITYSIIKTKSEYRQKFINAPNIGISWFALILVF